MFNRNRQRGFTLIELLIVVAIIGIIAAILIPNLLDALQKAKQKRTVADIRNVGTAWMSWLTDQIGGSSAGAQKTYDATNHQDLAYNTLFEYLNAAAVDSNTSHFYMQEVPQFDAWGGPLDFGMVADTDITTSNTVMIICSPGRDNNYTTGGEEAGCENQTHNVQPFIATNYAHAIIWADGYMVNWPE